MVKKFATFSLFIFIATVAGVVIIGLVSPGSGNQQAIVGSNTDLTGQVGNITGVSPDTIDLVLSPTELAKHDSAQSCWLLISGKIYDVTSYLYQHPGNASTILPTCGTDATVAYATQGGGGSHSSSATAMLAAYYIGDLNQTVVTGPTPSTSSGQATPTVQTTSPRSRDDDDDD